MAPTSPESTCVRSCLHHRPLPHQNFSDGDCFFNGGCQDGHAEHQNGSEQTLADRNDAHRHLPQQRDAHDKSSTWMSWQRHGPWNFGEPQANPGDSQGSCSSWTWEAAPVGAKSVPRSNQGGPSNAEQQYPGHWSSGNSQQNHQTTMSDQVAFWTGFSTSPECCEPNQHGYHQYPDNQSFQTNHTDFDYSNDDTSQSEDLSGYMEQYSSSQTNEGYFAKEHPVNSWAVNSAGTEETSRLEYTNEARTPNTYNSEGTWLPNLSESSPSTERPVFHHSSSALNWGTEGSSSRSIPASADFPVDLVPEPPTTLVDPPNEDMHPEDIALMPQRRNLKDPNHLYLPRWTRGNGKHREAWCGACRPGCWLSLKRSTYWYHKNFCHGITVAGTAFPRPTRVQKLQDEKGWEGLCGTCGRWVALNGAKKSHTSWFRHAYKCGSTTPRPSPSKVLFF